MNSGPPIHRTHFPLMLAFVCAIHKVQDLTLPSIVVSFNLNRQKKFNYGQLYVALNRVKSLRNLYIEGQVTKEVITVDPNVEVEYCRLKTSINENKRFFDPNCEEINNAFVRLSQVRN